uniref:CobW/HypB/UreG nucleotide-binding domain-containing protein n=1 Tax=Chromera velia CCMP2878 TaxID=1169474 RepID=A0A0G4G6G2_9ALVE|eukprot:Cvel_20427.t1-p1 / transcript=Cvel_20427.t1 / gene=Cvel_20427 / organism=Chromera_velia_CCMP2878 / gene_product=Putative metal chaperone YciC, putative / transcript_product=Putative metal chaperone YciC, putative / location=Cvel_scaffold1830:32926-34429(-) / protein_length=187 / sequence_SO=supercontig / SO=protein_coding / is_pseudo=false
MTRVLLSIVALCLDALLEGVHAFSPSKGARHSALGLRRRQVGLTSLDASIASQERPQEIPVTILSGFLGTGKTTMIKHILANREGRRVAIVVNDFAESNIDARMLEKEIGIEVKDALSEAREGAEKAVSPLLEISNGCMCCTAAAELGDALKELARSGDYDAIVVESSGQSADRQTRGREENESRVS